MVFDHRAFWVFGRVATHLYYRRFGADLPPGVYGTVGVYSAIGPAYASLAHRKLLTPLYVVGDGVGLYDLRNPPPHIYNRPSYISPTSARARLASRANAAIRLLERGLGLRPSTRTPIKGAPAEASGSQKGGKDEA